MTSAWFLGAANSVPQDESEVRSTVDPVRTDNERAEQENAPDWNEHNSDNSGQLMGLAKRDVGSATYDRERNAPINMGLITASRNQIINDQVATSGTAAAREAAGQRGTGVLQYAIGIEPANPAQVYGNDYFLRDSLNANEGSGSYMAPPEQDNWASQVAQVNATKNAREAYQGSLYQRFLT